MWATAEQKKPGPDDKLLLHFAATGGGGVEIGVGTLNEKYRDKKWAKFFAIRPLSHNSLCLSRAHLLNVVFKGLLVFKYIFHHDVSNQVKC